MICPVCKRNACQAPQSAAESSECVEVPNIGYRTSDNQSRWSMIRREIKRDSLEECTSIEFGSNFGFFSLNMANINRKGRVFSIEGSFGTGNSGSAAIKEQREIIETPGIKAHIAARDELSLNNNSICLGLVRSDIIKSLLEKGVHFDYLFCLSVFHWIVDASIGIGVNAREMLADQFKLAGTTFIELPDMSQGKPLPDLYSGCASIPEAMHKASREHGVDVRITYLGSSPWYGTRDIYRVDNIDALRAPREPHNSCSEILNALGMGAI